MKIKFTLLFCIYFYCGFSQNVFPPNHQFTEASMRPCVFDSTHMMLQADHWLIYQTLDDTWNGVKDSTHCIGVKDSLGKLIIELDQIDIAKPVFVKSILDDSTKILLNPDWIYEHTAQMEYSANTYANFSPNCANGFCTGLIVGIEIPDSTGTTTDLRFQNYAVNSTTQNNFRSCLVTERFEESYWKENIFKFKLLGTSSETLWFRPKFSNLYGLDEYIIKRINRDTIAYEFQFSTFSSSYNLNLIDLVDEYDYTFQSAIVVMYHDSTYPSAAYPSYLEITPEVNDTFQKVINLELTYEGVIHFQPFTELKGGLIEGSDSIRHHINIINFNSDMCFSYIFIELTFAGGDNYIHQGGTVEMNGAMNCFRFQEGSSLIVADDTHFDYGKNGLGVLALATGGTIQLGKNSSLNINNKVWLYELDELRSVDSNQQIFMNLNEGSELVFGKDASLDNKFSVDRNMKLNIYMNGGQLDISNLSEESKAVLNLIYPTVPIDFSNNVKVFPNPVNQEVNFSMILDHEELVEITAFDLSGKLVATENVNGQKGKNSFPIQIEQLITGIYFFRIKTSLGTVTKKVFVRE